MTSCESCSENVRRRTNCVYCWLYLCPTCFGQEPCFSGDGHRRRMTLDPEVVMEARRQEVKASFSLIRGGVAEDGSW